MGLGLGSSWQSSDSDNAVGFGGDFFIGSPIYQRDRAFFALDWRFHFVAGINRAYSEEMEADGSYHNVQFRHFNYDLELLLTLNRLREQTGIILGIFGTGSVELLVPLSPAPRPPPLPMRTGL